VQARVDRVMRCTMLTPCMIESRWTVLWSRPHEISAPVYLRRFRIMSGRACLRAPQWSACRDASRRIFSCVVWMVLLGMPVCGSLDSGDRSLACGAWSTTIACFKTKRLNMQDAPARLFSTGCGLTFAYRAWAKCGARGSCAAAGFNRNCG